MIEARRALAVTDETCRQGWERLSSGQYIEGPSVWEKPFARSRRNTRVHGRGGTGGWRALCIAGKSMTCFHRRC